MICRFLHRGAEDDNAAVATNITKTVHWSRAGVNSSVSHGQMPSDKLQWWRRSFQQLLFRNWKLFHPVPLISLAVWARCCVACLVELKAALQQANCRLAEALSLPLRCSMRLGCRRRVWTRQAKARQECRSRVSVCVVCWKDGRLQFLLFSCLRDLRSWLQEIRLSLHLSFEGSGMRFLPKARIFVCRLLFLFWG